MVNHSDSSRYLQSYQVRSDEPKKSGCVGLRWTPRVPSSAGQLARTSACRFQFSISIMRTRISTFNHEKRDSSLLIMSDYLREGMSEISMPNGSSSFKSKRIISVANLLIPSCEGPASPYPQCMCTSARPSCL